MEDLPLSLIVRINRMNRIILLHFLIMLESIPCLAQRLQLKAELLHYHTAPGFTPHGVLLPCKNGLCVRVADSIVGLVTLEQLHQIGL